MKPAQGWAIFLLLVLVLLGLGRSQNVRSFFTNSLANISGNLGATASHQAATSTAPLDWHLFLYWFAGALLIIALSDVAPQLTIGLLVLIIAEELLVHWNVYSSYLAIPTK